MVLVGVFWFKWIMGSWRSVAQTRWDIQAARRRRAFVDANVPKPQRDCENNSQYDNVPGCGL